MSMMKKILDFFKSGFKNVEAVYENIFCGDLFFRQARRVVLEDLNGNFDGNGITGNCKKHVDVIVCGIDELTTAIIRQLAFICHYPNFDEKKGANRTKISIIYSSIDFNSAYDKIKSATGNLLNECCWSYYECTDDGCGVLKSTRNCDSYIDIELDFVNLNGVSAELFFRQYVKSNVNSIISLLYRSQMYDLSSCITDIHDAFLNIYEIDDKKLNISAKDELIDVRKAQLVNMIYNAGINMNEIYAKDIYNVQSYNRALSILFKYTSRKKVLSQWNNLTKEYKLSNIFCADCFDIRARCAMSMLGKGRGSVKRNLKEAIETNLESLAKVEHARWNVEKLLLGYRAYTKEEHYADEFLFGHEQAEARKLMKNKKIHIDICSYSSLIRIDPYSSKYDCLLTLAIDDILDICK